MSDLYPLRFEPIFKRLIWGGRGLGRLLGKPIGPEPDYAESWELADHGEDDSRVCAGALAGVRLSELVSGRGEELLGRGFAAGVRQFPLLVKFLDAHEVLSVQVHPDDELARKLVEDNGKTEAWVIVHAEPGSLIYAGLKPGVTRESLSMAIDNGAIQGLLHRVEPRVGDCLLIKAGTVHAIGAGVLLAEIQQMSDATFRIHDWGRVGPDGRPRRLHREEALMATDFSAGPVEPVQAEAKAVTGGMLERLVECSHFVLERLVARGRASVGHDDRFTVLMGLAGRSSVLHKGSSYSLKLGETLLLPAVIGRCELAPETEEATVLCCSLPDGMTDPGRGAS